MKILFLINENDNHSVKWVEYFKNKGYGVEVLDVKRKKNKIWEILFNLFYSKNQIRKNNPEILHALYAGVNGILAAFSGFHPFFLTVFGSDVFENRKNFFKKILIKYVLKRADIITCNSKILKDAVIELGASPEKIRFVFWATDIEKFKPNPKLKKTKSKTILSIRNLEPVYDIETLIKAVPVVLKDFLGVNFLIAGEGSQKTKLELLSKSLGVDANVKFIGWIKEEEVPDYLNLADIYVSTSLSDGDLAQSTQQAMACEVPIITSDIEVNKHRIKDGKNGLLFPKKNHYVLAEKIKMLLADKPLRKKLGKEGRKTIKEELNFYKEMEKAEDIYKYKQKSHGK